MATLSLTFNACGGSSATQKIYYGKKELVTGKGATGTGWTLYTGAPIAASTTSATIVGLDSNVEYVVNRYCTCPSAGDTGPEETGPYLLSECPVINSVTPGSTTVAYTITPPTSLNASGTWVKEITIELFDSSGVVLIKQNFYQTPFSSTISGSFQDLNSSTSYKLRVSYYGQNRSRYSSCPFTNVTTIAPCSAPNVLLSNTTYNSTQVSWSVAQSNSGDSYNIVLNGTTVASGLPISASPYLLTGLTPNTLNQINVARNCGIGGSATGTSSVTTPPAPTTAPFWVAWDNTVGTGTIAVTSNISGFNGPKIANTSSTLLKSSSPTGVHNLTVQITIGNQATNWQVNLVKNSVVVNSDSGVGNQTVTFNNVTIGTGDFIQVRLVPFL